LVEIQNKKIENKERRVVSHTYNVVKVQVNQNVVTSTPQGDEKKQDVVRNQPIHSKGEKKSKKDKKERGEQGKHLTSNRRANYMEKKSVGRKYPFNKTRGGGEESRFIENSDKKTEK
jgi:hypothetical protein